MKRVALIGLSWGFCLVASSHPFEGKSPYEILDLDRQKLNAMDAKVAEVHIAAAMRRLAIRFHPDREAVKGLSEAQRAKMFKAVADAKRDLMNWHVHKTEAGPGSQSQATGGRSPRPSPGPRTASGRNARDESAHTFGFDFASIFAGFYDDGLRMYQQMESEMEDSMLGSFPRSPADAVYQAVMGNGFGDLGFYERFPKTPAAFLEFLRDHLDTLLDPADGKHIDEEQMTLLREAVRVSGNPPDLAEPIDRWLRTSPAQRHGRPTLPGDCAPPDASPQAPLIDRMTDGKDILNEARRRPFWRNTRRCRTWKNHSWSRAEPSGFETSKTTETASLLTAVGMGYSRSEINCPGTMPPWME